MKKIAKVLLKIFAQAVLWRQKPKVVGISGSFGKTSAKEAVVCVLSSRFLVRGTYKNYNNELGLPLTILGQRSPGKNLFSWLKLFVSSLNLILFKSSKYPQVLVLEMGVDHPGDMDYLLSIIKPDCAILTGIGPAHLEFFGSQENILKEKIKLAKAISDNSFVFINGDDQKLVSSVDNFSARVKSFGFAEENNFRAIDWHLADDFSGLRFKLDFGGATVPIFVPGMISRVAVYALLAGVAVADFFALNLVEISETLKTFRLPVGRMNLLAGKKDSLLIDDSYNSSPEALRAALEVLGDIKYSGRKVAVLGDMLELGTEGPEEHRAIAKFIKQAGVSLLITVGSLAKEFSFRSGVEEVYHLENSVAAAKLSVEKLLEGDLVLIKASQGIRLEKVVKALLKNKDQADQLLVRQDLSWK